MEEERERAVMSEIRLEPLDATKLGEQAEDLKQRLLARIVGQDEAVFACVESMTLYFSGLTSETKPICCLLLIGPTGSGKTELCKVLAEILLGSPDRLVRIDCGEYTESHEVAKLKGSPPGYVSGSVLGLLHQRSINKYMPYSEQSEVHPAIICFDEIERASEELRQLLMGVLDCGRMSMGDNTSTDFRKSIILLTSNVGTKESAALLSKGSLGFSAEEDRGDAADRILTKATEKLFNIEWRNRLDATIVFKPLSKESARTIVDIELGKMQSLIMRGKTPFAVRMTDEAKAQLLEEGFSTEFGGRAIKRTIEKRITKPLARLLSSGSIQIADIIFVGWSGSEFTFCREATEVRTVCVQKPTNAILESLEPDTFDSDNGLVRVDGFERWYASLPQMSLRREDLPPECPDDYEPPEPEPESPEPIS
jgi:ATP-dependent Clp protease ATP-binding subunit ClpA